MPTPARRLDTMLDLSRLAIVFGLLLCAPLPILGQSGRGVAGVVRDSAGRPIAGAEVRAAGVLLALTNDSGHFRVAQVPEGTRGLLVRRLGFAPARVALDPTRADSVQVALGAVASALPEVRVRERRDSLSQLYLADFWERRARGFGTFVTRDEIERLGATDFVQLLRHYPSVRVTSSRGQQDVRFNRGGDCPPQYWVDGMPLERASARDFTPYNVEAVELYPGSATIPGRFARGPGACGAIVIWTRLPG